MSGLHRLTVKKYLEQEGLPLYRKFARRSALESYYGLIEGWLTQQDYLATRIYELVVAEGYTGSYDTVRRYVKGIKEQQDRKAYIRFETLPGQQAQVDFADFQITCVDGTIITIYCFVMVLGYSRHMYIEFVDRCTMPKFLECHQHGFGFFGGIPAEILYDNMKNVVIRRLIGSVQWNETFAAFAAHYGFKPIAAPPYSPWVKGKVERPIGYVRERFWRGYGFSDIDQANRDIHTWLLTTAFQRLHGTTAEKVSERFEREHPSLGTLPPTPFDTSEKAYRIVHKDCQLAFGGNRYVVPHECVGKKVLLKVKDGILRVFDDDYMVTVYRIPQEKGKTIAHPRFYERLKADRLQNERKYRFLLPGKAKATRGLLATGLHFEVMARSLATYDESVQEVAHV
jgi:transposase